MPRVFAANGRSKLYDDVREAKKTGPAGNRALALRTTATQLRKVLVSIMPPASDNLHGAR